MRVRLLIPYFGAWPSYFPLYLGSCAHNPWLEVLFLTDLPVPERVPPNVQFVRATLEELSERFSARLDMQIRLRSPYKLCDFKPAYGFLFSDHLAGVDYWAHGDIDLVYGRLQRVFEGLLQRGTDVVSCSPGWISGPLCLYRNREPVNQLFRESRDHRMVFEEEQQLSFGECSKRWKELLHQDVFEVQFPYDNMTLLVKRAVREGRLSAHFGELALEDLPPGGYVSYEDGRVLHRGREYPYFHWVMEKYRGLVYPEWREAPDRYFITRRGFYREREFGTWSFRWTEGRRWLHHWLRPLRGTLRWLWRSAAPLARGGTSGDPQGWERRPWQRP